MSNLARKSLLLKIAGLAVLGMAVAMPICGPAWGQEGRAAGHQQADESAKPTLTPSTNAFGDPIPGLFSLSFKGGSVAEYVSAVRSQSPIAANITAGPGVAELPMPPIHLKNVSVEVAVRAVETVTDSHGAPVMTTRTITGDYGGDPLYVISARADAMAGGVPQSLRSFSVSGLLDAERGVAMPAETLLGAIESLLTMENGEGEPPRVMLHKETSTLIMRARKDQLVAVEDLLVGLERDAKAKRDVDRPNRMLLNELEAELRAVREKREILTERMKLIERNMQQAHDMAKQGLVPQSEIESLRERDRDLEEQRIELELREAHLSNRMVEASQAVGGRTSESMRVAVDSAEKTLQAAVAIGGAMSPTMRVSKGSEPGVIEFTGTPSQIAGVRGWLRAQGLLAE